MRVPEAQFWVREPNILANYSRGSPRIDVQPDKAAFAGDFPQVCGQRRAFSIRGERSRKRTVGTPRNALHRFGQRAFARRCGLCHPAYSVARAVLIS
jgi:hypothetical protein